MFKSFLIVAFTIFALPALAQKKEIPVNFENELIEGKLNSPELEIVLKPKPVHHGRLVKLKQNFLKEMQKTKSSLD